ncbi:bifunctional protein-disulfide isomerase/oxidoreductase DsbC [Alkalimonas collagenimarina]|uniref:Thiol:disulfide interchange protein n=1 Tax=Alkalimonas collagenimarina TaxID=400390 RepID=A0ABT9GYE0_9GAMM|nr:bifunctional protein-disulfide isomerase/oxidoreductase DsbC [Alkalimonas collagenimarina]MDP4536076.1 bifunctional protein-disulfide isomerase/oxidoreductase DsbC [Alkalimonas collagenimarina]
MTLLRLRLIPLLAACVLSIGGLQAETASDFDEAVITQQLTQLGLQVNSVSASPVKGLAQVFTNRGLFFISNDGAYFFEGSVFDIQNRQLVNEQQMRPFRQQELELHKDYIEYKAKDEQHVVTIFTDPSCGYCRRLHNDMKDYNNAGITVRYLAFPRGGLQSETNDELEAIWCARDKNSSMDRAKAGRSVSSIDCRNPVANHYALGQSFGVTGTPAIVLPSGQLIPGYQPANALLQQLNN